MAFGAATIWDVRTTGSDANGGGFSTLVTNMATDLAATSATGTAPVCTSASYNFVAADVGHWLYIGAGTNWTPGWYQIASVASNAATLTATAGTGYLMNSGVPYAVTTADGCATTASPTGGTWSIDYSQSAAAAIAYTDAVVGATTTQYTSVLNPGGPNLIGNIFNVTSGATVQRVQITVFTAAGLIVTCDKSLGTAAQVAVGNFGGALVTPGLVAGLKVNSNSVFVKDGSYTCSSSGNVAGGKIADTTVGTTTAPNYWIGWNAIRTVTNLDATKPLLKATANSMTVFATSGSVVIRNIKTGRNASETSVVGFSGGFALYTEWENCVATALATGWSLTNSNALMLNCLADTCATGFSLGAAGERCIGCESKAHTAVGFTCGENSCSFINCIAWGGTGSADGFKTTNNGVIFVNCTSYGNAGAGFTFTGGFESHLLINCVATGNSGKQFNLATTTETSHRLLNCAAKADGTGTDNFNIVSKIGFIILTADPFTNAASGDFSLNTTSGGGAACRAAGIPGVFPGGTTTGYLDIGAVQHADPAASGGMVVHPGMGGRING